MAAPFPPPAIAPITAPAAAPMSEAGFGPWNPGIASAVPRRLLPLATLYRSENVLGSLEDALDNIEKDHEFLLTGDVFTPDVIETWLDYKRTNEIAQARLRPHPYEFALYYDI